MEVELDICLRVLGPRVRVACTLEPAEDGERRFVVEEVGPGAMCSELMAVDGYGFERRGGGGRDLVHSGRAMGERGKERGREEMTGGGCLGQKKGNEGSKPIPRTRTGRLHPRGSITLQAYPRLESPNIPNIPQLPASISPTTFSILASPVFSPPSPPTSRP